MPEHLTEKLILATKPVPGQRMELVDDLVPGLRLRITQGPAGPLRAWALWYRTKTGVARRFGLGAYPDVTLGRARERARDARAEVQKGGDPQGALQEKRRIEREDRLRPADVPTVATLVDAFLEDQADDWRPATRIGWERYLRKEVISALGKLDPHEVRAVDIDAMLDRIRKGTKAGVDGEGNVVWKRKPAPVSAERCYEVVRRMFLWGATYRDLPNPCLERRVFEKSKKSGRRRATSTVVPYTNEELRAVFAAAKGTNAEHLIGLIAHCGTRDLETRSATWREFDLEQKVWAIPPSKSKTGDTTGAPHVVPLSTGALAILKARREANLKDGFGSSPTTPVFPTLDRKGKVVHQDKPNKVAATVKTAAGLSGRGLLHRFRHTLKTRLSDHGVDARVSEHILGHVVAGIGGVYDHAEVLPQRRAALEWWSGELRRILAGDKGAARKKGQQ